MKAHKSLFWLLLLTVFVMACKKEYSYEKGKLNPSAGSLQSGTTGDCLGSVVQGTYKLDTTLNDSNYVDVKVDVTTAGDHTIRTDTINVFISQQRVHLLPRAKIRFAYRETEN